jgi:hypothetical protein
MSKSFAWASPLGVSPQELEAWIQAAGSTELLISWCIKNQKIDADSYLKWARNFYGLPTLNSAFFEVSPKTDFFESVSSMPFWSSDLLPLCEWDGVLFIACSEPLSGAPWSFPVQFLLASPTDMSAAWQRLHKVEAQMPAATPHLDAKINVPTLPEMPAGLSIPTLPDLPDLPEVTSTSASILGSESSKSVAANEPEMPVGLAASVSFKLDLPSENSKVIAFPIAPVAAPKDTPLALSPVITEKGLENKNADASVTSEPALPLPPKSPAQPKLPPDEEVTKQFSALSDVFSSMQILEFLDAPSTKSGQLKVIAFYGNWSPKPDAIKQLLSLDEPSIFRIATRTKLPYHGYVVPSEANEKFFQNWGIKEWPDHVTLAPIKDGKKVLGLLLGVGSKNSNTPDTLKRSEEAAKALMHCFNSKGTKAA